MGNDTNSADYWVAQKVLLIKDANSRSDARIRRENMEFIRVSKTCWIHTERVARIERMPDNSLHLWSPRDARGDSSASTVPPAYADSAAKALGLDDWKGDGLADETSLPSGERLIASPLWQASCAIDFARINEEWPAEKRHQYCRDAIDLIAEYLGKSVELTDRDT